MPKTFGHVILITVQPLSTQSKAKEEKKKDLNTIHLVKCKTTSKINKDIAYLEYEALYQGVQQE